MLRIREPKTLLRFVRDTRGMEMAEWAIIAVVFAVSAAVFWGDLATALGGPVEVIGGTRQSGRPPWAGAPGGNPEAPGQQKDGFDPGSGSGPPESL